MMGKRMRKRLAALLLVPVLAVGFCCLAFATEEEQTETETSAAVQTAPEGAKISAWARQEVNAAYEAGLIPGEMDWGLAYKEPITRAQFARLAVELVLDQRGSTVEELMAECGMLPQTAEEGETAQLEFSFTDCTDAYVELAARLGIVQGSGGAFYPDGTLKRCEAALMLQRSMEALGFDAPNSQPMTFEDAYTIPHWAREGVKFISGRTTPEGKAVMGGTAGNFLPRDTYSIEQAIVTVFRCAASCAVEQTYEAWKTAPGYDTVSLTMTFGGDCTFGRSRTASYSGSFDEMYDKMGAAYFFSNVKEFFEDDLTMVNFEGALTTYDVPREEKPFVFKGRAEYAKILEAGSVDVVTVANNHARDYGNIGLADTKKNLAPYVAVSGFGDLPIVEVKGVKVGFASALGWSFDASQKKFITDAVKTLRSRGAEVIVFNYHWGEERQYKSNATQKAIGRYCIDQGADLVIGHHPHVVQEVETYKGKTIVYSLGNLCFGGNRNPTDKNCLLYQYTVTLDLDTRKIAKEEGKAIPYKISSVNNRNDYRPTPA